MRKERVDSLVHFSWGSPPAKKCKLEFRLASPSFRDRCPLLVHCTFPFLVRCRGRSGGDQLADVAAIAYLSRDEEQRGAIRSARNKELLREAMTSKTCRHFKIGYCNPLFGPNTSAHAADVTLGLYASKAIVRASVMRSTRKERLKGVGKSKRAKEEGAGNPRKEQTRARWAGMTDAGNCMT